VACLLLRLPAAAAAGGAGCFAPFIRGLLDLVTLATCESVFSISDACSSAASNSLALHRASSKEIAKEQIRAKAASSAAPKEDARPAALQIRRKTPHLTKELTSCVRRKRRVASVAAGSSRRETSAPHLCGYGQEAAGSDHYERQTRKASFSTEQLDQISRRLDSHLVKMTLSGTVLQILNTSVEDHDLRILPADSHRVETLRGFTAILGVSDSWMLRYLDMSLIYAGLIKIFSFESDTTRPPPPGKSKRASGSSAGRKRSGKEVLCVTTLSRTWTPSGEKRQKLQQKVECHRCVCLEKLGRKCKRCPCGDPTLDHGNHPGGAHGTGSHQRGERGSSPAQIALTQQKAAQTICGIPGVDILQLNLHRTAVVSRSLSKKTWLSCLPDAETTSVEDRIAFPLWKPVTMENQTCCLGVIFDHNRQLKTRFLDQGRRKRQIRRTRSGSAGHAVSSAICKLLRYYTGASSDSRVPQQLSFAEGSGAVREMMSESARALSFGPSVTADTARWMASAGLFQSATDGRVRCAFCQGALESGSLAEGESPMRLHARQFPTCPFVLGMDVGNKPDLEMDGVSQSEQCSEASETSEEVVTEPGRRTSGGRWRCRTEARDTPLPPPQTLRSAAEPRAVQALEMLELEASRLPIEHPSFVRQSDRLRTLENIELFEPADQFASAGFFLQTAGTFNLLICFACNLRLSVAGSQLLGNASIAHAAWSPRCGHLLSSRGAAFVRRVRQFVAPDVVARFSEILSSSRNHGRQDEQQSQVKMSYSGNLGVRYRIESREIRARSDVPSARMAIRLGFSATEVRTAMEMRLMFEGDDFATSEQLLAAVVSQHDALTVRSMDIETFREAELHRLRSSSAFGEPEESPETDWRTCKVCMVHRINVILLDCGHLCCCSRCSANLQTCPICRKVIRAEAPKMLDEPFEKSRFGKTARQLTPSEV
uniref:RING-type domain-containing protein n=1 Tax=Macrostomum lignano TaxID=282301 RepID=A0A1I8H139_9PLAT